LLSGNGELGMFAASSRLRIAAALSACTLASLFAAASSAQSIDLSLNVFYTTPSNNASGGTWELVAKSSPGTFGISGINAYIRNINSGPVIEGPRGIVNGSNVAGFEIQANIFHAAAPPNPAYQEITVAQKPLFQLPSGSEENLFYGVGTLSNGAPNYPSKPPGSNSIGPAFTSLTSPQDIPWAVADAFNDAAWATAARLLSGTFATGVTPAFFTGSSGNVFTSVPATNTALGNEAQATAITTVVRTNFVAVQSADYNRNGTVDAADYVLWRKTQNTTASPAGSGADGNVDGTVNGLDYTLWASHFGNPLGSGAGGGLSTATVPEPTTCALLTIGALLILALRRSNFQRAVNN
jgi:hypothetical protein